MFGFGFSKEKSRASAEKYLQQNKLPQAISEYEKILKVEPRDLAILNTVGDIYSRLGQNEKAIERFVVVAESYGNDGSLLKSIAVYKKITKLNPNGLAAMEKLAELYRKQGLVSDARSMLLQAAEAYTRKGQSKETLRLLKQLVIFDPENVQVITRTADLMTQSGQKNEAKEMLSQTAATLVDRHARLRLPPPGVFHRPALCGTEADRPRHAFGKHPRVDAWRGRPDPVHAQEHPGLRHRQSRRRRQRAEFDGEFPEGTRMARRRRISAG